MGTRAWRAAHADLVRRYWREWYYRNREQVAAARRQRKRALWDWLQMYKQTLVCLGCGERDPAALDFHHTDPTQKDRAVGDIGRNGWSRRKLLDEIGKCE